LIFSWWYPKCIFPKTGRLNPFWKLIPHGWWATTIAYEPYVHRRTQTHDKVYQDCKYDPTYDWHGEIYLWNPRCWRRHITKHAKKNPTRQ
jgi:hypothetical protein